ncbi:caspase, EACC1-associated type [Actinokineospora iranica]|uniref:Caspase domain-containing protein n=1 Tax=Actinokineospora iranica TaxID=1271860 RepID=A0A1G6TQQ9_9PSEU|nr:caspase family protein [Actinokineospora iranica]SDD31502.1 Caspase domain-containing protein [Actinokineospora iranica]
MRLADPRRSRIILVGSAHYDDPDLDDLPSVRNNVADLAATLTDPALGSIERCHTFLDLTSDRTAQIERLARDAEDLLLIYFAGHGLVDDEGLLSLAMKNTEREFAGYNVWQINQVRSALHNSPAQTRVLILDSCYSGRALRQIGLMGTADEQMEVEGVYTLTSSPANQPSVAPPGERHTAFTGELITLLRDGVPGAGELLSMGTIYQQLNRRLRGKNRPMPKQYNSGSASRLALVRNRAHQPAVPTEPFQPPEWLSLRRDVLDGSRDLDVRVDAITGLVTLAKQDGDVAAELTSLASNGTLPILLRVHCVHEIGKTLGEREAVTTLDTVVGAGRGAVAWRRLRRFVDLLDDDSAWYTEMAKNWDIDPVLAEDDPDRLWSLLMAMMLAECGLSLTGKLRAAQELAQLGRPGQARHLLRALLLDRRASARDRERITAALAG